MAKKAKKDNCETELLIPTAKKSIFPYVGRKPGVPNSMTTKVREGIWDIIEGLRPGIVNDINSLVPRERVDAYIKLLRLVCPKPQDSNDISNLELTQFKANIKNIIINAGMMNEPQK